MPTTRRSTGGARAKAGPGKGQSTISFSSKVTKSVPNDTKKALLADSFVKTADVSLAKPVEDEVDEVEEKVEEEVEPEEESAVPRTDAELRAEKITSAQLAKYWKKIEGQRKAPRVHQQDVTLGEKILRYFDVSSQYGVSPAPRSAAPCLIPSLLTDVQTSPASAFNGRSAGSEQKD